VRVYDAFLPVDEFDDEGKFKSQVATLRVIAYLEDLGPVDMIKEKEIDLEKKYIFEGEINIKPNNSPVLPSENFVRGGIEGSEDVEKVV
jgi:hypothetical protein